MSKLSTLEITGKSGSKYSFDVYHYETNWNEVGAVYAVTKRTVQNGSGSHNFIYIGHTDNLKERHGNHHKADCFAQQGANCLCVHGEARESVRLAIEADLLAGNDWPCNG